MLIDCGAEADRDCRRFQLMHQIIKRFVKEDENVFAINLVFTREAQVPKERDELCAGEVLSLHTGSSAASDAGSAGGWRQR